MTFERFFYAVARLARFIGLGILFAFITQYLPWVAAAMIIIGLILAHHYHVVANPDGYFKGRLFTDIALLGILFSSGMFHQEAKKISEYLPYILGAIQIALAIAVWIYFYKLERESIKYADRKNVTQFLRLLIKSKFWAWVFIIIFGFIFYGLFTGQL